MKAEETKTVKQDGWTFDGCPLCRTAYSFVFQTQFHSAHCPSQAKAK
jgi:hypothetical protein